MRNQIVKAMAVGGIYVALTYVCVYVLARQQFSYLVMAFTALFALQFLWVSFAKREHPAVDGNRNWLLWGMVLGLGCRFMLIFALPNLSDDYFRFFWDGCLWTNGVSPFLYLPQTLIAQEKLVLPTCITPALYEQLNSPTYFTIYPPVCQWIFALAVAVCPNNIYGAVVVMKSCLYLFDFGSMLIIYLLLKRWQQSVHKVLWYALNPLVIIELVGNMHFEAAMVFFLLLSLFLLQKYIDAKANKRGYYFISSALAMGLAVCAKLLPLMFLPLLIRTIGWWKSVGYGIVVVGFSLLSFYGLLTIDVMVNLLDSIDLYFRNFEFNASVYYLLRGLGYVYKGFNLIAVFGPLLAFMSLLGILLIAWRCVQANNIEQLAKAMLLSLSLYLVLATTIHPWYVCTLVALGAFTGFRYAYVWSVFIILSYAAYQTEAYVENYWLIALEYGVVFTAMYWDFYRSWVQKYINS